MTRERTWATDAGLPFGVAVLSIEKSQVWFGWRRVAPHLAEQGLDLNLDFAPRGFVGGLPTSTC